MSEIVHLVTDKVKELIDPETGLTFGEMELIQKIEEVEPGNINIEFTPTNPYCPIALNFAQDIKKIALAIEGVKKVTVYCRGHTMEKEINQMVNEE